MQSGQWVWIEEDMRPGKTCLFFFSYQDTIRKKNCHLKIGRVKVHSETMHFWVANGSASTLPKGEEQNEKNKTAEMRKYVFVWTKTTNTGIVQFEFEWRWHWNLKSKRMSVESRQNTKSAAWECNQLLLSVRLDLHWSSVCS